MSCVASVAQAQPANGEDGDEQGFFGRLWDDFSRDLYVGVQVSVDREPYVGEDVSVIPFPRPGRLRDYTFEKGDRFAWREGVAMGRLAMSDRWELNAIGFFDFRRYRPEDNDALVGLDERKFGLGAGLGGAWRGNRTYVEFWGAQELLGRSGGQTYGFTLGLPLRFREDRFEFVPHVDVLYDSEATADYYYGVEPDETVPGRPAYEPQAAITTRLAARLNYRFPGCWGLSGRFGIDLLANEIKDSPIVDRPTAWDFNVAVMRRLRCKADEED